MSDNLKSYLKNLCEKTNVAGLLEAIRGLKEVKVVTSSYTANGIEADIINNLDGQKYHLTLRKET